jgi:penicillin-insensitive murein endopeptidase
MFRLLLILALLAPAAQAAAQERPAKELFGATPLPAALPPEPIGFYSRGCLSGGVQLPPDGPTWQAMRLSRNRQWGLPILVDFIEKLAHDAATLDGWPGLLVGDLAQPRGGPMLTGHASHQTGLDGDIWLTPMPERRLTEQEREDISAVAVVEPGPHQVFAEIWTPAHGRLIRRAALDPRVERIFVAPGIKKKLCETAGEDRAWLRKVRPYYGHNYHFHVRLSCPPGAPCRKQSPPPPGDGCGSDLDWWFTDEPYRPAQPSDKAPKEIMLSELPPACRTVLLANPVGGAVTMRQAFNAALGLAVAAPEDSGLPYIAEEQAAPGIRPEPARLPRPRPATQ